MITPFDPEHITPDVSLNRVFIMDLPGVALDADIRGQRAGELLAARSLAALIRQHAAALRLKETDLADEGNLPLVLDRCLVATDLAVRRMAAAIALQLGRRLGALVLTLKRGDVVNRAARPEWDDSYWGYWACIRQIWVGGGLVNGRLGPLALEVAAEMLAAGGVTDCTLRLAEQPGILPLLGAARSVPSGYGAAGVLDFGGTAMKRGVALYAPRMRGIAPHVAGALAEIRLLPPIPTDFLALEALPLAEQLPLLGERMVGALAATWQAAKAADRTCAPVLVASIACYVRDNQPMRYQRGLYSELQALSPNLGAWLAARVSAQVGRAVTVRLIHDGTAAARVYAGTPHAAVITLGTALGVGFPPAGV